MKLPDKKYSVIYADPPWSYRQHGTGPKSRGNAAQHYHTMTTEDICALPIRQLAGGGGARMCAVHVGDISASGRCAPSYGSVGLYIQNSGFRLGEEKPEKQHSILGYGRIYQSKRGNLLTWRDTGFQTGSADQEPCSASNYRSTNYGS